MFCLDGIFRFQKTERRHINDLMQYNTCLEKYCTEETKKRKILQMTKESMAEEFAF